MICPICGYEMNKSSKCIRCGYIVKTLAVTDESKKKQDEQKPETKVIDPCNVYLTHPYGYDDGFGSGFGVFGGPFSSIFDELFGDPISDLLGGLFGIDVGMRGGYSRSGSHVTEQEHSPQQKRRKQGPIIEVRDVEVLDNDGNPLNDKHGSKKDKHDGKSGRNDK